MSACFTLANTQRGVGVDRMCKQAGFVSSADCINIAYMKNEVKWNQTCNGIKYRMKCEVKWPVE